MNVTRSKAIYTGIQQITTRTRRGVETSRSVSATYYALVVGDRLLVVKGSDGIPQTAEGELAPMPASLESHLFNTPQMQAIRPRFYPYYVDNASFRLPGYIAIACLLVQSEDHPRRAFGGEPKDRVDRRLLACDLRTAPVARQDAGVRLARTLINS